MMFGTFCALILLMFRKKESSCDLQAGESFSNLLHNALNPKPLKTKRANVIDIYIDLVQSEIMLVENVMMLLVLLYE